MKKELLAALDFVARCAVFWAIYFMMKLIAEMK